MTIYRHRRHCGYSNFHARRSAQQAELRHGVAADPDDRVLIERAAQRFRGIHRQIEREHALLLPRAGRIDTGAFDE
jgi:hypothetical protein